MSVLLKRVSALSGKEHLMVINTTVEKMAQWEEGSTLLIQDFFPELSDDEREFILTGITIDEWANALGPEE